MEQRQAHKIDEPDMINTPGREVPEIEPEPEASPEMDMSEPEAVELEL
jgi:hypothetical protein